MKISSRYIGIPLSVTLGSLFIWAVSKLPVDQSGISFDLGTFFWPATHLFRIHYVDGLYAPPWTLALLWPLTVWPINISRGFFALAILLAALISVRRHKSYTRWLLALLLLLFSHPVLRQLTELNIEFMPIFGALLLVYALREQSEFAMAGAAFLLSAKIQESWLLAAVLGLRVLYTWPRPKLVRVFAWSGAFTLPLLLWKGAEWLEAMLRFGPKATDSSLRSIFSELGVHPLLFGAIWLAILIITLRSTMRTGGETGRSEIGMLLAAGLLLSPYASNTSVVTPLAIGVPPFVQRRPLPGTMLMSLFYLPYFILQTRQIRAIWENTYSAIMLLIIWGVMLWDLHTNNASSSEA